MRCPDHSKDFNPLLADYFHHDVVQTSSRKSISCLNVNNGNDVIQMLSRKVISFISPIDKTFRQCLDPAF